MVLFEQKQGLFEEQQRKSINLDEKTRHAIYEPLIGNNGRPFWATSAYKLFKQRGDFFGEICLLDRPHRRLSAMAKEHCILLELN